MSFSVTTHTPIGSVGDWIELRDTDANSVAVVAPARGALVRSFAVGSRELLYLDDESFADHAKNVRGGIPVLFPAPGRLNGDAWRCNGRNGVMQQHGFARSQPWSEVARRSVDAAEVTLALHPHAALQTNFPWQFAAQLVISLQGATLRLRFELTNLDTAPLPYALGFHPYFSVADKAAVVIPTQASIAYNNRTRAREPFTHFDLTADELDLHLQDHGKDHCDILLSDGSGTRVRASAAFTRWVVWTLGGKPFVCVEPWTAGADALNTGELLLHLPPNQTATHWMEIEAMPHNATATPR